MTFRFPTLFALVLAACAAPLALGQDGRTLAARTLAATCGTCHGTDGRAAPGATAVPPLAGVPAAQIVERVNAFRSGERPSTVMQQIAKGYSEAQIEQIARWFAGQTP
jgi:cytochrome c553